MTLAEISASLLNGFHDAELRQLSIDYDAETVFIRFDLWIGIMVDDESIRERFAKANLLLKGMQYCVIEKPEDNRHGLPSHFQSSLDDFETATQPRLQANLPGLKEDYFAHSFFVFGWNSFIHIAARSAQLTFDNPDDQSYNDLELQKLTDEANAESSRS